MEFKGTKGQWRLRISGYGDYIAIDSERQANSDNRSILYKAFNPTEGKTDQEMQYYQEWKANAQLIATAPELLEVVQKLIELQDLWLPSPETVKDEHLHELQALTKLLHIAMLAIEKATKI